MNTRSFFYTPVGLEKLAKIIREARGKRSYREFEAITGVSHGVIRRIEIQDAKQPDHQTLSRLAPHTSFTLLQLQAIAMQQEELIENVEQKIWQASDVLEMVEGLPDEEVAKLIKLLVDRLLVRKTNDSNGRD